MALWDRVTRLALPLTAAWLPTDRRQKAVPLMSQSVLVQAALALIAGTLVLVEPPSTAVPFPTDRCQKAMPLMPLRVEVRQVEAAEVVVWPLVGQMEEPMVP